MAVARRVALAGALGLLGLAPVDAFWSWGSGSRNLQAEEADKAKKTKSPQKIDNQREVSHWPEFGPGECGVYTRGDAELAFCLESLNEFHKDIKKVSVYMTALPNRSALTTHHDVDRNGNDACGIGMTHTVEWLRHQSW